MDSKKWKKIKKKKKRCPTCRGKVIYRSENDAWNCVLKNQDIGLQDVYKCPEGYWHVTSEEGIGSKQRLRQYRLLKEKRKRAQALRKDYRKNNVAKMSELKEVFETVKKHNSSWWYKLKNKINDLIKHL